MDYDEYEPKVPFDVWAWVERQLDSAPPMSERTRQSLNELDRRKVEEDTRRIMAEWEAEEGAHGSAS